MLHKCHLNVLLTLLRRSDFQQLMNNMVQNDQRGVITVQTATGLTLDALFLPAW